MKVSIIILAAGLGSRMNLGYNKMLYEINEKSMLENTVDKFIDIPQSEIIITYNDGELEIFKDKLKDYSNLIFVKGGSERQYSVFNALQKVTGEIVLVHDGARPFIDENLVLKMIDQIIETKYNYVMAVKAVDSIREVENGEIIKLLERDHCYIMQTPQGGLTKNLIQAHEYANAHKILESDEVGLFFKSGQKVKIFEGNYDNYKITHQQDLK